MARPTGKQGGQPGQSGSQKAGGSKGKQPQPQGKPPAGPEKNQEQAPTVAPASGPASAPSNAPPKQAAPHQSPLNKLSGVLKVVQKGQEDVVAGKDRVIATLDMAQLQSATLLDVRKAINLDNDPSATFCYKDFSPAQDALLLSEYLAHENEAVDFAVAAKKGEKGTIVPCVLFIAPVPEGPPPPAPQPVTTASMLSQPGGFAVMVYELTEDGPVSRGAIQSNKLGVPDATILTLAGLRKHLSGCKMSTSGSKHKFCTPSGMPVVDEAMTFAAYLQLEETQAPESSGVPSVMVFYSRDRPRMAPHFVDMNDMPGKVTRDDFALTGNEFADGKKADKWQEMQRVSRIQDLPSITGASSNPYAVDAGYLTEGEWNEVMRNCGLMFGWIVDRDNDKIMRAPKAAFQLRTRPALDQSQAIPETIPASNDAKVNAAVEVKPTLTPAEEARLRAQELRKKVGNWNDKQRFGKALTMGGSASSANFSASKGGNPESSAPGTIGEAESDEPHGSDTSRSASPDPVGSAPETVVSSDGSEAGSSDLVAVQRDGDSVHADSLAGSDGSSAQAGDSVPQQQSITPDQQNATQASNLDVTMGQQPAGPMGANSQVPGQQTPVQQQDYNQQLIAQDGTIYAPNTQSGTMQGGAQQGASQLQDPLYNQQQQNQLLQAQQQQAQQDKQQAQQDSTFWTPAAFMRRAVQEVPSVMPSFQVNDNSRIEIMISSHEFETSMARNDFSGSATEGSMSGGYGGFAVGISAGKESSQSSSSKKTNNSYKQTMIAKYLLPRADVFLHPDDLEPTPELRDAIEKIRVSKNIADLRQLHADFGQLWCQQVTIGGRLQSTKILEEETGTTEQAKKEAYKTSFGIQVTTPYVSAGVKHTSTKGSEEENAEAEQTKQEKNVFEAVGGDTILASNPELWAATVADFRTWRVIDRGSLSSLIDTLSAMPGYGMVRSWFMRALPMMSRYIELPPSREVLLRFKVNSPTTQLSLSHLKQHGQLAQDDDPVYYFGHTKEGTVSPVENSVNTRVDFWTQIDLASPKPLFSPQSYRAPVLLGYAGNKVGDSAFGTAESQEYNNTLWTVSAPFNEALQHNTKVCLQTVPLKGKPVSETDAASAVAEPPYSLAVFRNQQGVFLPGLSDAGERQFWRIMKVGGRGEGDYIREGDEIYFSWRFSDQTSGFRDFTDDVFGRRRYHTPKELSSQVLFLKLPWPRFEPLQPRDGGKTAPNAMMMSTERPRFDGVPGTVAIRTRPSTARANDVARVTRVPMKPEATFAVQDVTFRVDLLGNGERGESRDRLLAGVDQEGPKQVPAEKPELVSQPALQVDVGQAAAWDRMMSQRFLFEALFFLRF